MWDRKWHPYRGSFISAVVVLCIHPNTCTIEMFLSTKEKRAKCDHSKADQQTHHGVTTNIIKKIDEVVEGYPTIFKQAVGPGVLQTFSTCAVKH